MTNIKNTEALTAAINEVEGKATARTVCAGEVQRAVERAESQLKALGIPQRAWKGVRITIDPGHKLPNSYRYAAEYTRVIVERTATAWRLVSVARAKGNRGRGDVLTLTEAAKLEVPTEFGI